MTLRLLHYSDVHLTVPTLGWRTRDVLSKKAVGWVNVKLLGRGRRFRFAPAAAAALMRDIRAGQYDGLVFSGDATTLAFDREFAFAAKVLDVGDPNLPPAVAVPGNHDYYTWASYLGGYFEKHFAAWQQGARIDEERYPFARKVGHTWLVCVNSATANLWPWDASGRIGPHQLDRMVKLCRSLDDGPRVVVTHYPLRTAKGKIERRSHRLRDHKSALAAAADAGVGLWLHGHLHGGFVLPAGGALPFPVICAGSCTQAKRWMYNAYEIAGRELTGVRRVFDPRAGLFAESERFEVTLG